MLNDANGGVPVRFLDVNLIWLDYSLPSSYRESNQFKQYQKEEYFKFRKTIYNEETLNKMIDGYTNYLSKSGAIERDVARWKNDSFEEDCQKIKNYFKGRIAVLDEYYGGI